MTAIRASQLGLKTAMVEREALRRCLSGAASHKALLRAPTCLVYIEHAGDYGIKVASPKADFGGMVERRGGRGMSKGVTFLMKKNNIDVIVGTGKLMPGKKLEVTAPTAPSPPASQPHHHRDGRTLATSLRCLKMARRSLLLRGDDPQSQPKKMVVVGSGAIGVEFAYFYNAIGTEVTVVEYVVPRSCGGQGSFKQLERTFKKAGIDIMTSSEVTGVDTSGKGLGVRENEEGRGNPRVGGAECRRCRLEH